jgi:hypothetical protein
MSRLTTRRALVACAVSLGLGLPALAQSSLAGPAAATPAPAAAATPGDPPLEEVRRALLEQQEELKRMRALIDEQSQVIGELRQRVDETARRAAAVSSAAIPAGDTAPPQTPPPQDGEAARLGRVEEQAKRTNDALTRQLGTISFSGDLRLRYESIYGQLNASANADNPAALGNELSARQRFRVRVRLNMRGQLSRAFEWGLRLGTGSYADAVSNNQTLTDFYNRKPFSLDNAYVTWKPKRERACREGDERGLRLQGGKFETPWARTEMTLDNDLYPEGFSQTYSHDFGCVDDPKKFGFKENAGFRNLTFVAWQLPFLERNSAFVRDGNGTVNVDESRRAGRDLALYGAQLQTRVDLSPDIRLTLSAADLYFSGTQFISPIQVFGPNLQLPVTITVPATATSPAQTLTTQVSIPRDQLVSGNANLGLSIASNNATGRDGRLASGYNLIDLIGRLDLTHSKRVPVTLLFNFVTNTRARDVSVAGPGGATLFLPNNENRGYWAELQLGKPVDARDRVSGDMNFDYTFMRIEKDAVLTPFNASDIGQPSDVRVHRLTFDYMALGERGRQHNRTVRLTMTAFFTQRANGLLGPFATTPAGSLNRPTTRLQFDTLFRF